MRVYVLCAISHFDELVLNATRKCSLNLSSIGLRFSADAGIVRSNISVLVKEGLGERAETDFLLVRDTCSALLKTTGTKKVQRKLSIRGIFDPVLWIRSTTAETNLRLAFAQKKAGELQEPFRLAKDHEMFSRLSSILVNGQFFCFLTFYARQPRNFVSVCVLFTLCQDSGRKPL